MSWAAAASVAGAAIAGKSSKDAASSAKGGSKRAARQIEEATAQARSDVQSIFPQAEQRLTEGARSAFDIFNQALQGQQGALSQGNLNAQGTASASLPQIQAALLGTPVSFDQFQPQGITPQPSFTNPLTPTVQQQQQPAFDAQAFRNMFSGQNPLINPTRLF